MGWFKVDDSFHSHPKVLELSPSSIGIWLLAGTWCAQYLTDGRISIAMIRRLGGCEDDADALVASGMWDEESTGNYRFHDWEDFQPSADEWKERREQRSKAAQKAAKARWDKRNADAMRTACDDASPSHDDRNADAMRFYAPTRPDPKSSSNEEDVAPRDDVEALCTRLRDRMVDNGFKEPTITKAWRKDARLLLDKDGRELDKALNLIDWAHDSTFWRANIKSMSKFRDQYDTLRLQAVEDWNKGKAATNPDQPHQIDADAILGKDYWQVPEPPAGLSLTEEIQWKRDQQHQHQLERQLEAKEASNARRRAES